MKVQEYKLSLKPAKRATKVFISSSRDAFDAFNGVWSQDEIAVRESFKVMYLDRSNQVKGFFTACEGAIDAAIADIRLVFGVALKSGATSIILAHNHPSGKLVPSSADMKLTNRMVEAGRILDIAVLDHLILSYEGGYYSFADEGTL